MSTRIRSALAMVAALVLALAGCSDRSVTSTEPAVAAVRIAPSTLELMVGDTVKLVATPVDVNDSPLPGRRVTWRSSNYAVAAVDSAGRVVGRTAGAVTIVAASEGREAERHLVVSAPPGEPPPEEPIPAYIELNFTAATLPIGGTRTLIAAVKDVNGVTIPDQPFSFTTADASVATITAGGFVTAVGAGTAKVKAASGQLSAEAVITVLAPPPATIGLDIVYTAWSAQVGNALFPEAWLLDVDSGDRQRISWSVGVSEIVASPDGSRYLVVAPDLVGMSRIYVVNADGSGMRTLIDPVGSVHLDQPAWSPDGSRIAYRQYGNMEMPHDVWVVNADGSEPVNLTASYPGQARYPSFSPRQGDGKFRIAFAYVTPGTPYQSSRILTIREDGSVVRQVTPVSDYMDDEPSWSPNGSQILFTRTGLESGGDIWIAGANGEYAHQLMPDDPDGPQRSPSWSPNGQYISFTSAHEIIGNQSGRHHVYTIRADGTQITRRTSDPTDKIRPAWRAR